MHTQDEQGCLRSGASLVKRVAVPAEYDTRYEKTSRVLILLVAEKTWRGVSLFQFEVGCRGCWRWFVRDEVAVWKEHRGDIKLALAYLVRV